MPVKNHHFSKLWLWLVWPLLLVLLLFASLALYHLAYAGRIFSGIKVGAVDLSGLTVSQAEASLQKNWQSYIESGIPIKYENYQITIPALLSSANPELVTEFIHFSAAPAAAAAYRLGRRQIWYQDIIAPALIQLFPNYYGQLDMPVDIDIDKIVNYIKVNIPAVEELPQPAAFTINASGELAIVPENSGFIIDRTDLVRQLMDNIQSGRHQPVYLRRWPIIPPITQGELEAFLPVAQARRKNYKLIFSFANQTWSAEPSQWQQWIQPRQVDGKIDIGLSPAAAQDFFAPIKQAVEQPAQNAKFEIKNGRAEVFQASALGREVDVLSTLEQIEARLVQASGDLTQPLVVKITEPEITTAAANNLGVSEIIGVGKSNFAGSPVNRRHNIKVGASTLNGIIIKPDEEFSLVKALGVIDAAAGYLPELVIKNNKTIPEFGGGLCQIGTTTFRAALSSGLPILERRNHSYRVPYYEPAGTDATIYDPKPDFRFKNDTGYAILIQTKINGDDLIFEFWGTKDGRVVEQTKPRIYNIVKPPPTKIIETDTLPPGEKKCTEKAHSGADTEFEYKVTYASGEIKAQTFRSHYVPWQEVCLVGVISVDKVTPDNNQPGNGLPKANLPSADITGQTGN